MINHKSDSYYNSELTRNEKCRFCPPELPSFQEQTDTMTV